MTATAELIKPFVISRVLPAPRPSVWKTWTERDHMAWWGPKGTALGHAHIDLRPGGLFHYSMKTPDGREMWGRWVIRDIVAPQRMVFIKLKINSSRDTTITTQSESKSYDFKN